MSCVFCDIVAGTLPSTKVYEDDTFVVFPDLNPIAKVHWLIVPKLHVRNILDCVQAEEGRAILKRLTEVLPTIAQLAGVAESGFRLITNCGRDGGQSVDHLHFHLLGGEPLEP